MITISTNKGDIKIELHEDTAPKTAANFLEYVRSGFYQDTIFHRVISGFMIQCGGMTHDMSSKTTNASIKNEGPTSKPNKRGTLAMARTMDPDSATAQFFINLADNAFLNFKSADSQGYGYCVFGEVVEGMDVVDEIAAVQTGNNRGHDDVPLEAVVITGVTEEVVA